MIIDAHAHIRSPEDVDPLLRHADLAGIDKICICSLGRIWKEFPEAGDLVQAADDILAACEAHPDRFIGGTYVSADHIDASMEMIERCHVNGPCRFIKLWVSQYADDPRLDPLMDRIVELDAPVLAHTWIKATGNMQKESTVGHVVNRAQRSPGLKIWFAHASGRWEESARIAAPHPDVALDISGGEPEDNIVDCLIRHMGPERIFYGSDVPGRSYAVQMSKVLSAEISDEHKAMILGENVRRWLHV